MLHLEIITPEKTIFQGEIDNAIFPGTKGKFQVLKNHAAIISPLTEGEVIYTTKSKTHKAKILGGVVEVLKNKITLLATAVVA